MLIRSILCCSAATGPLLIPPRSSNEERHCHTTQLLCTSANTQTLGHVLTWQQSAYERLLVDCLVADLLISGPYLCIFDLVRMIYGGTAGSEQAYT
jgi:hypothetical protein